ncbi:glycoside hydrolase family 30 protein [Paenibacillus sp. TH7-28]
MVFIACVAALLYLQLSRTGFPAGKLTAESWLTTPDRKNLMTPQPVSVFSGTDKYADAVINVDAGRQYQTMEGFGAAVTGSSAYLIGGKLSASQREALVDDLFTEDGIRLSYVRHTIGASDFSVDGSGKPSSYTYDDVPPGETDFELNNFSVRRDARVIGLLREIVNKNQQIKVLGAPWTAPPWMKYGETVYNGWYLNYTDERVYRAYADYFVKYIQAYEAAGVPINAITVQNEPEFTTPDYPSMSMGAEEQAKFIGGYLGPALERSGLDTKIIAFDHNWDLGEPYARTVLGEREANKYTEGTAYHCYSGEPDVMTEVHDAFPDKAIYFTECSGGSWSEDFGNNLSWLMSKLLIGATRNWSETVLLWNLALDPEGGPVNGGCADCRGVVTIDPENGAVTRNAEYYALGHASKFVAPGAVRIDSSPAEADIENVAFRNADGTIVLIAANTGETPRTVKVVWKSRSFAYSLPAHSAVTFRWPGG